MEDVTGLKHTTEDMDVLRGTKSYDVALSFCQFSI